LRQVGGADGVGVPEQGGAVVHSAMTKFIRQSHPRAAIAPKSFLMNATFDGDDYRFFRKLCFTVSIAHRFVVHDSVNQLSATAPS